MDNIVFDYSNSTVKDYELQNLKEAVTSAHTKLHNKTGQGKEYCGWIDYPMSYDNDEYQKIKYAAKKIRQNSEVFIVIGIGGSYLGPRAVIEMLNHSFFNNLTANKRNSPEIYFTGNSISGKYLKDLLEVIEGKDVSINVISKSGTTTEPAIAFRILRSYIENKYGEDGAKDRIYVTTDKSKGALKELAEKEGYETFVIPDDIGGRYSVMTPVGMLPIAVSGIDTDSIIEGARSGFEEYSVKELEKNPCYIYAAIRNILYNKGKLIEVLVNYEPSVHYFAEWWKQLFGESEGKDGKGIYPSSVNFSTDLHSLGQYLQDGRRHLFETVINIENSKEDIEIINDELNLDGLNYLAGKNMDFVNKKAFEGTLYAHIDGGVPNLIVNVPVMNEYYLGKLIYFFEKACAMSGYLLGVNPFNQPGVEAYKENMFALLGKPGFEELRDRLNKRITD